MKKTLKLSNKKFHNSNEEIIRKTFIKNCHKESFVESLIRKSLMKINGNNNNNNNNNREKENLRYISFSLIKGLFEYKKYY